MMNEQNIYELAQYFNEMVDRALDDLRQDLLEKVNEMLQDLQNSPELPADLTTNITKAGGDNFANQTFDSLGDFAGYAAISSVLPNFNASARLPRGLDNNVVFRPALRRIGNLAGKNIASSIFDASGGKINYGAKQLGSSIFAELFSSK